MNMAIVKLSSGRSFQTSGESSILDSAFLSQIALPYSCKTGRCSACKCRVVAGQTKALIAEIGLSEIEKSQGWILSCVRIATTDIDLEVEDFGDAIVPEARMLACRINSLDKLAPDVIKVVLRLPPKGGVDFLPGQYINIIGPGGIRRSYSIANAPRVDNLLEIHIRAVAGGVMSQYWFNQAAVNDLLRLHGPQGTFFLRNIAKRDLIFLATGTGIAPVKAMLEALPSFKVDQHPQSITVVWGARHEHDLYFDVEALPNIKKYIPVLSRAAAAWQGERGYVQDALLRHMFDLRNGIVYACGSDAMIDCAKSTLTAAGLPSQYFYSDAFVCSSTLA